MDKEEARQVLLDHLRDVSPPIDIDEATVAGSPETGWVFGFEDGTVYMVHPDGEVSCMSAD